MGIIVGALPGLGCVSGASLLLPLTFKMDPTTAIITLASLYYGTMFGGAISAILINMPGDAPAVMTAQDGYPMAKKGYAGRALFTAFFSSMVGGLTGAVLLTCLGGPMSLIGLKFGPPEIAMLILVAMTSIGWILGESPLKGLVATSLGLLFCCIGVDKMSGLPRLTYGIRNFLAGFPFIPACIGMFGMSQVFRTMMEGIHRTINVDTKSISYREALPPAKDFPRIIKTDFLGAPLGFFIGMLPGAGATAATFIAYITEKRIQRKNPEMGKGAYEGIAICESANNAASVGAFVPLLSLGIPGSGTTAIIMGGLMMWGLQPGPLFMSENPQFSWALIASFFTGDLICVLICLTCIPLFARLLKLPNTILIPIIICLSIMGTYCVNNSLFDVMFMIMMGVAGYIFNYMGIPQAPISLALILGPILEMSFRQSMTISNGDITIFIKRPISLTLLIVGVVFVLLPVIAGFLQRIVKPGKA